jgi:hypothetical protein
MTDNPITIENCEFTFECPMNWEKLIATDKEHIRYCSNCDRGVYLCLSDEELNRAMEKNRCVALRKPNLIESDVDITTYTIGNVPMPKYIVTRYDEEE